MTCNKNKTPTGKSGLFKLFTVICPLFTSLNASPTVERGERDGDLVSYVLSYGHPE